MLTKEAFWNNRCRLVWWLVISISVVVERIGLCLSYRAVTDPSGPRILFLRFIRARGNKDRRCYFYQPVRRCSRSLQLSKEGHGETEISPSFSLLSAPTRLPVRPYKATSSRKPRGYWKKKENIEHELRNLWIRALTQGETANFDSVDRERYLPSDKPPPIPNHALLNHWKRFDMTCLIQRYGLDELAELLGGAEVIPGKWKKATHLPLIQRVVELDKDLSIDEPPPSPQQMKLFNKRKEQKSQDIDTWKASQNLRATERKRRGYWTKSTVVLTLFQFLNHRKQSENIPAVWMPQMTELQSHGWSAAVVKRFGSSRKICQEAGLVPVHEWKYFERQYELLLTLKDFCDQYMNGDYTIFPKVSRLSDAEKRLVRLTQEFGGTTMVASRLGMAYDGGQGTSDFGLNWGSFDLECGIALMDFVRSDQLRKKPPLCPAGIFMPTPAELLEAGKEGLHAKIMRYGGYENVARRLGLGWIASRR
ncbi:hypothetical protein IV203_031328 [Nitzschia inconspicua]|uniref:Uncharacterized protein n=1 Tax=Nitzschia inconspicua TaxID=303405 RepID=A0A9K3LU08_9STRA|nr:hypothetical protein IV203_031328 [Nitzschia inconspicua]